MNESFRVIKASCNDQKSPLGLDTAPHFSWKMASPHAGDTQVAYQLGVSSSQQNLLVNKFDIWDSATVPSEQNYGIYSKELQLEPDTSYFWRVKVWNRYEESACSESRSFHTGKRGNPFDAKWISAPFFKGEETVYQAPYFHKKVTLSEKPVKAMLYISGLGYYSAYLEGQAVTDSLLNPAFTRYDQRTYYNVYDVLSLLKGDTFALGVVLGNGWYNCFTEDAWNTRQASWRANPKLLCELHLEYKDGRKEKILSDTSWDVTTGPIYFNGIRNGEYYDARKEKKDWNLFSQDISTEEWEKAIVTRSPGGKLLGMEIQPIRVNCELPTQRHWKTTEGSWIFDLGQNFAGIVRLKAVGRAGSEITLCHGELLTEDQQKIDNTHLSGFTRSGDFQTDRYIKKGDGEEIWSPLFVYHGFRYVEVSGFPDEIPADTITGLVIHTDFTKEGNFHCSDKMINDIYRLCHWSMISNFHSAPTDCPHREKNSWTGDAAIVMEQAMLNYDSLRAWKKWMDDIVDSQRQNGSIPCVVPSTGWGYNWGNGPDWSNALTYLPWTMYIYTGNEEILREYYPTIRKHFEFMTSMSSGDLVDYGIGDWCAPFEGEALSVNMGSFKAPRTLTDSACYYNSALVLSKIENILGFEEIHKPIAERISEAIRSEFLDPNTFAVAGDCQTSDGTILFHSLAKPEEQEVIVDSLVSHFAEKDGHLDFGLLGSRFVPRSLGEHGKMEIVYEMLQKQDYPGYGFWLSLGYTTLGEIWSGKGSRNHYMFSDISAVMYRYIAGIQVEGKTPGFREFTIAPTLFDKIDSLSCQYQSIHGEISVDWEKEDEKTILTVRVPFGTTAKLRLPSNFVAMGKVVTTMISGTHRVICTIV